MAELLSNLVPDLETAARAVPGDKRAEVFELLATTYQACSAALEKIGEPDAAWIAADRAMAAAERAGNAMLVAAGAFRLVFVFIAARHYAQAEETARTAAAALWPKADQGDPQAMSLREGLTLQRAVIAARTNEADTAYGDLERAGQIVERLGEGHNEFNTQFGPSRDDRAKAGPVRHRLPGSRCHQPTVPTPAGSTRHAGGFLQPVLLRGRVDQIDGSTGGLIQPLHDRARTGGLQE